jgi:hypothetical protein
LTQGCASPTAKHYDLKEDEANSNDIWHLWSLGTEEYAGDRGQMPRSLSVSSLIGPEIETLRRSSQVVKERGLPMYLAYIWNTPTRVTRATAPEFSEAYSVAVHVALSTRTTARGESRVLKGHDFSRAVNA